MSALYLKDAAAVNFQVKTNFYMKSPTQFINVGNSCRINCTGKETHGELVQMRDRQFSFSPLNLHSQPSLRLLVSPAATSRIRLRDKI